MCPGGGVGRIVIVGLALIVIAAAFFHRHMDDRAEIE
jgi:hypothetical protein